MDISNWPMSKIMQLPADAFGRRELVQMAVVLTSAAPKFVMSLTGLPDKMVIWEVIIAAGADAIVTIRVRLALGIRLPASTGEFEAMEKLFSNVLALDGVPGGFEAPGGSGLLITKVRFPVVVSGRRLIARVQRNQGLATSGVVLIAYSAIPTEIPDYYAGFPEEKFDEMIRLLRIGVKIR